MPKTMNEEKVRAALARLRAERAEIAEYAADLEAKLEKAPKQEDFDKLRGQLRGDRHRAAFEKACDEAGVRKDARADLYDVLKLQADADEPDAKAIAKAVKEGVESRPWAKEAAKETAKEGANHDTKPERLPAGEGSARGSLDKRVGGLKVRSADLSDPHYMLINQKAIADAVKAGEFSLVD